MYWLFLDNIWHFAEIEPLCARAIPSWEWKTRTKLASRLPPSALALLWNLLPQGRV